jgi:hypothetical protein
MPEEAVVAGGAIWIERTGPDSSLVRFDPLTQRVSVTVRLDYVVALQVADDGSLWAVGPYGYAPGPKTFTVSRVDLETGQLRPVADIPSERVAIGLESIWFATATALIRLDWRSGVMRESFEIAVDAVDVGCDAVWGWKADGGLIRLDPTTGETQQLDGEGPILARSDACWRPVASGIERVWPMPVMTTTTPGPSSIWFEGSTFWRRPSGSMQRWDPWTGSGIGPTWTLDERDISPYPKIGDDGLVLSAGGWVWLVNGFEVVGFDIRSN